MTGRTTSTTVIVVRINFDTRIMRRKVIQNAHVIVNPVLLPTCARDASGCGSQHALDDRSKYMCSSKRIVLGHDS